MARLPSVCRWVSLREALSAFVSRTSGTQSAEHIKPLHWYVACRLVLEGGFHPNDVKPRPPFVVAEEGQGAQRRLLLAHDETVGQGAEQTVLGGLKTKRVDVVVAKEGIGPCIAVSLKGTLNAFRNLTNRMEEAVGECTNLHIAYPALVCGFLHVLRATREHAEVPPNDVAVKQAGEVVDSIVRYHDVLARLAGRDDVRSEPSKYESVAVALVEPDSIDLIDVSSNGMLTFRSFFDKM